MTSQAVAPVLVCGLDQVEVAAILQELADLGYQLPLAAEIHDPATHRPVQSDDALNGLIRHLQTCTALQKLNSIEAMDFYRLISSGRRLLEPIKHKSNLKTTEAPYARVKPLGSGMHTGKTR